MRSSDEETQSLRVTFRIEQLYHEAFSKLVDEEVRSHRYEADCFSPSSQWSPEDP
jgi:hypothetical protein